jgi:hypothetical protein
MSEQFANHSGTTLTAAISSTTRPVTFTVASSAGLPSSGNFRVLIDSEILLVTTISGTSLTGSNTEGTTAATHANGAPVNHILTAGALLQLETDVLTNAQANANVFSNSNTFNGGVTLGAGLNLNGQTVSGSGTFSGSLTFSTTITANVINMNNTGLTNVGSVNMKTAAASRTEFQMIANGSGTTADIVSIAVDSGAYNGGTANWLTLLTFATSTGQVTFGGVLTFASVTNSAILPNSMYLASKTSGGTTVSLLGVFTDNYTKLLSAANGVDIQNAGGTTMHRFTNGGNVLIGTTTDNGFPLQVSSSSVGRKIQAICTATGEASYSAKNSAYEFIFGVGGGGAPTNSFFLWDGSVSGGALRLAVPPSGNLLINTVFDGGQALQVNGSVNVVALATPGTPTVTPTGTTGSTSYSYAIVAKQNDGSYTVAGAAGSTSTGNATLSGTNYNAISWSAVTNAASYDVYRTVGGAAQGRIATSITTTTLNDTGLTASGSVPTTATTGGMTCSGTATLQSGLNTHVRSVTANDTATTNDRTIVLNGSSLTETLPATPGAGQELYLVNIASSSVTVGGNGHNIWSAGTSSSSITLAANSTAILQYDSANTIWRQIK